MRQMLRDVILEPMTKDQELFVESIFHMMFLYLTWTKFPKRPTTKLQAQKFISEWESWYYNMEDLEEDICLS